MNITIELFFSAPSRLPTLLYIHDKHTAKYLVVCQYYIHLSPETIQKLPLGSSFQGMEKCIPNLPFPSVQAVKYPKQLSERKILKNTFTAEIRFSHFPLWRTTNNAPKSITQENMESNCASLSRLKSTFTLKRKKRQVLQQNRWMKKSFSRSVEQQGAPSKAQAQQN